MIELDSLHCIDWQALMEMIPDSSIDMILTDIPYGSAADKDTGTNLAWDDRPDLAKYWEHVKRVLKPAGAILMTATQPLVTDLIISNREWFRYDLVWQKTMAVGFLVANRRPLRAHEYILLFSPVGYPTYNPQFEEGEPYAEKRRVGSGAAAHYSPNSGRRNSASLDGKRYPKSVLTYAHDAYTRPGGTFKLHPTQKPLALFEWLIKTYTNEGETVLDMFAGSGTTALAAKLNNRRYIVGDISPAYIEIIGKRLNPKVGESLRPMANRKLMEDLPMFAPKKNEIEESP